MRFNSAYTTDVKHSNAARSPALQAFNKPVTSADTAGFILKPAKRLSRTVAGFPRRIRPQARRQGCDETSGRGGGGGSGNGRLGGRSRQAVQGGGDGLHQARS